MAKTIMISNEVYSHLKRMKGDRSFSQTLKYLMEEKSTKKTGAGLRACLGLLPKDDHEYDSVLKESRLRFNQWMKRYA